MTPSPGPSTPAGPRRRWTTAVSVALLVGIAVGSVVAAVAPGREAGAGAPVETRVAGISIERSSVDAAASTPTLPTTTLTTAIAPAAGGSPDAPPAPTTASPAPTAVATTTPVPPITAPAVRLEDSVRAQVLAAIPFPWQEVLPGWRIDFLPERAGYRGSTFPDRQIIEIYLRPGLTIADYVHVTAHELGHAVDVTLLDDADHERWNLARGRAADAAWWVASGADDFSSGAGDWAECFAWSQLPSGRFYSRVAGIPTDDQQAVMADIIAS